MYVIRWVSWTFLKLLCGFNFPCSCTLLVSPIRTFYESFQIYRMMSLKVAVSREGTTFLPQPVWRCCMLLFIPISLLPFLRRLRDWCFPLDQEAHSKRTNDLRKVLTFYFIFSGLENPCFSHSVSYVFFFAPSSFFPCLFLYLFSLIFPYFLGFPTFLGTSNRKKYLLY